ncbi:MAG: type VI secretion system tube protein Hcp [Paucibacter sp.]|nr:type VI secretion system tube protein Hcp [Roseateles sp.]
MANDMLFMHLTLKGKPVPGDSKVKGYEGQIELKSLKWGLAIKDRSPVKSDAKATKNWEAKEIRLSKFFDGASTALFQHMDERANLHSTTRSQLSKNAIANKAVISLVGVSAVSGSDKMPVLLKITLGGVRIKSLSSRATESGSFLSLNEELVLAFLDVQIDYFPADKGSTRGGATTFKLEGKDEE